MEHGGIYPPFKLKKTVAIEVAAYLYAKKLALFCYTESHDLELQDASLLFQCSNRAKAGHRG